MQDEVNEKTISLCINGGKISARILKNAVAKILIRLEQDKHRGQSRATGKPENDMPVYHGKQSMAKLRTQNVELSNIEITDGNIKSFEKCARKYNVDYCLKKDNSIEPPRYYVFFKAKDVDVLTAAFKEYTGKTLNKNKKPSIRKKLELASERVTKQREREKIKHKERGQEH